MNTETLKDALGMLAKPDDTASSASLIEMRDNLDLSGAQAVIDALADRRYRSLLVAQDSEIERIDRELQTANRDLDRRRAAAEALAPLIDAAKKREAEDALRQHGEDAKSERLRVLRAYVELDRLAIQVTGLIDTIRDGEAYLAFSNERFNAARRGDLRVGMPMVELGMLAGCDGQWLPFLNRWYLHGYSYDPQGAHIQERQLIAPERRFGRLAELLPEAAPAQEA